MTLSSVLYASAALLAVLLLAVLAGRAARAAGLAKHVVSKQLHVEESLAIDARRRLVLVRCGGGRVLLLTGPTDLAVGWMDADSFAGLPRLGPGSFGVPGDAQ